MSLFLFKRRSLPKWNRVFFLWYKYVVKIIQTQETQHNYLLLSCCSKGCPYLEILLTHSDSWEYKNIFILEKCRTFHGCVDFSQSWGAQICKGQSATAAKLQFRCQHNSCHWTKTSLNTISAIHFPFFTSTIHYDIPEEYLLAHTILAHFQFFLHHHSSRFITNSLLAFGEVGEVREAKVDQSEKPW